MEHWLSQNWADLLGRDEGPLTFRLIVQPLVAIFFAIRSGLRDAREGKPLFFWALFWDAAHRRERLRQLWRDVGKLFVVALVLDGIYQCILFHWIYLLQALLVALVLAIVPYLIMRGLTNRLWRWRKPGNAPD